jgi:hypothetical protein
VAKGSALGAGSSWRANNSSRRRRCVHVGHLCSSSSVVVVLSTVPVALHCTRGQQSHCFELACSLAARVVLLLQTAGGLQTPAPDDLAAPLTSAPSAAAAAAAGEPSPDTEQQAELAQRQQQVESQQRRQPLPSGNQQPRTNMTEQQQEEGQQQRSWPKRPIGLTPGGPLPKKPRPSVGTPFWNGLQPAAAAAAVNGGGAPDLHELLFYGGCCATGVTCMYVSVHRICVLLECDIIHSNMHAGSENESSHMPLSLQLRRGMAMGDTPNVLQEPVSQRPNH